MSSGLRWRLDKRKRDEARRAALPLPHLVVHIKEVANGYVVSVTLKTGATMVDGEVLEVMTSVATLEDGRLIGERHRKALGLSKAAMDEVVVMNQLQPGKGQTRS